MTVAVVIPIFVTVALVGMVLILLHNWWLFPRLKSGEATDLDYATDGKNFWTRSNAQQRGFRQRFSVSGGGVAGVLFPHWLHPAEIGQETRFLSILIPARNEAHNIGSIVTQILAQSYANIELLVLDDHSTDDTANVAIAAAQGDPRFQLLTGKQLPAGWAGKNWACHQLASAAQYDLLLFTDADVQWQPTALAALLSTQLDTQADLLTVWPTQITESWGERLTVPLMSFAIWAYLPLWLVHHTPFSSAAAANGQCMLFQRHAYLNSGGHAAIRDQVLDDVILAQRVKMTGGHLRMADGADLIACRMYKNWHETMHGFGKNILAGHQRSPLLLLLSTLFHLLVFVAPWLWLWIGNHWPLPGWPLWPIALIVLTWSLRLGTAHATHQRLTDAFLMPISVLLMTRIALQSLWWHWQRGGPQWKGRTLPNV